MKDTKEAQVTLDILKNAIGKNIDDAEVSLIKNVAVVQPEIVTFNEDDAIYLTWKTLGIPDYIGGAIVIDVWVRYEKFKLCITYKTLDLNDMTAGIDHLTIN